MANINSYKSHPDKKLFNHVKGVIDKVKELTSSNVAELAAIFHDAGKINPNFQKKISGQSCNGYSNHAYLSSYIFWCYYCANPQFIIDKLGVRSANDIIQFTTIIAKHHGNLTNFIPSNYNYSKSDSVLNEDELSSLLNFINKEELPAEEFFDELLPYQEINRLLNDDRVQSSFKNLGVCFDKKENTMPLSFFLDTQFSFASLILADKKDAGNENVDDKELLGNFCKSYNNNLVQYLRELPNQNIPINILRTEIRENAVNNLSKNLKDGNRVFTLTAPTGSGKTLMLLSLAGEIIRQKGTFRIIYALPFLSITEQVESEVLNIFNSNKEAIQRIDSKSENNLFEQLQQQVEENPSKENIQKLLSAQFQEDTFEFPFVITTFVRFFETLLSNKNATLMKLPNFSKSIFLIDEIQALPPRLYSFFMAFLSEFCKKFDSYAIISTATMPYTGLPTEASNFESIKKVFSNYSEPIELSKHEYFNNNLFNRYSVTNENGISSIDQLAEALIEEEKPVLTILNTIDDTKDLFNHEKLKDETLILLNTHFTPNDRRKKIRNAKNKLTSGEKILVISTQLIEAGVDIDFPVLYRDMTIMPSIVQSSGRCNRNGNLDFGRIVLFNLYKNSKSRASLIYRGKDSQLLNFTNTVLPTHQMTESGLFDKQKKYFNKIGTELNFGEHNQDDIEIDFVQEIMEAGFSNIGKFKLIDDSFYGEEFVCYIPENESDQSFLRLKKLALAQHEAFKKELEHGLLIKTQIKDQLKKMSGNICQIRIRPNKDTKPPFEDEVMGIYLVSKEYYSYEEGLHLDSFCTII